MSDTRPPSPSPAAGITGFDLQRVPFSVPDSYFAIYPAGPGELRLRDALHPQAPDVCALRLEAPFEVELTPGLLRLTTPAGELRLMIAADRLSLSGQGVQVELDFLSSEQQWVTATPTPAGGWLVNQVGLGEQYCLQAAAGELEVSAPWQGLRCAHATARLVGAPRLEASLARYPLRAGQPPQSLAAGQAQAFGAFLEAFPLAPAGFEAAAQEAAYLLWASTAPQRGFLTRPAVLMSKVRMNAIWSWDHAFNALALAVSHPQLAWDQFLLPFDWQLANGQLPDRLTPHQVLNNFTKPPIHGWAWGRLAARLPFETAPAVYEPLARWTGWWLDNRTWDGLPYYVHGFESGWDNATVFDEGLPLATPDLAAYLILQMEALAGLAERLQDAPAARDWQARADDLYGRLMAELWQGDRFVCKRLPGGERVDRPSLLLCLPLVLGRRLPAEVQAALIARLRHHLTEFGLATERPDSPDYTPDGYWRGPIWAPVTVILIDGLLCCGEVGQAGDPAGQITSLAGQIAARFCRLVQRSGPAENFDALTGAPLRDSGYTWTASALLWLLQNPLKE